MKVGKDKTSVVLPISYDKALEIALNAAQVARGLSVITEEQYQQIFAEYEKQVKAGTSAKD